MLYNGKMDKSMHSTMKPGKNSYKMNLNLGPINSRNLSGFSGKSSKKMTSRMRSNTSMGGGY